jgi:hypothetical protein
MMAATPVGAILVVIAPVILLGCDDGPKKRRRANHFRGTFRLKSDKQMANTPFFCVARNPRKFLIINHVPGGIRTPNLLIRSQKLYTVELLALLRT